MRNRWQLRSLKLSFIWLVLMGSLDGADQIRSISAVRSLTVEEANQRRPVRIEVQVMKFGIEREGFFAFDGKAGIYISLSSRLRTRVELDQGDRLLVHGVTNKGNFLPHIDATEIRKLGREPLPEPLVADRKVLDDPRTDCQWVQLDGVIEEVVPTGRALSLRLNWNGQLYNLVLPRTEEVEEQAPTFLNKPVRARGVAATQWNSRRQMTGRIFQLHSLKDIELIESEEGAPPLLEVDQMLRMETSTLHTVSVRGVVTHCDGKNLYLQGSRGALLVRTTKETNWEVGERVEAQGTVVPEPFAPVLSSWEVKGIGGRTEVAARDLRLPEGAFSVELHQTLVGLQATVDSVVATESGLDLLCRADGRNFVASLKGHSPESVDVVGGSLVNLRGICVLSSSNAEAHAYDADRFRILLRTPQDIRVLDRPSWWTTDRIILLSMGLLGLVALSMGWAFLLRRKVNEQTELIHQQVEREVTMRERERLARDLHDSLEQNIAGLARQLSTVDRRMQAGEIDKIKEGLFLARRMAEHCQKESRESIHDLRQNHRMTGSHLGQDEFLEAEAEEMGAKLTFELSGPTVERDARVERNLSKIIREATYNALRHGGADQVDVVRAETEEGLELSIRDNGCGFEPEKAMGLGRFGLQGMMERARTIGGDLSIESEPGKGTVVSLKLLNQSQKHPC
ncbi:sensor histidine kinase [Roseibacillus persicicus]|uniref:sensor histidine kinase n=1 Tax=Roseibacillus persicicus TaxID=454148 RepID=UPI002810EAF7|nr:sensor histidine kinase [Roseibacillus persicicus]